ncbi:MAG: type II toxin-antitoxin system VapC family toxin [Candidatus Parabeggiatoa sp.]|nr:type II toxin-antitoxin system VapC family toxin [Candidatus Parabeggiatoa sp.]
MNWLLDTCVLSEYVKKQPESKVIDWLDAQNEQSLFISVVSIGEIEKGITKLQRSDLARSQKLLAWLGKVEQRFVGRILPIDTQVMRAWANLSGTAESDGYKLPVMDALLNGSGTMSRNHYCYS